MNICVIIAEYNPFHKGHMYQINQIRETLGPDTAIVAVMSGNFVQRGDFAILDKHMRAQAALRAGVDLVLELPTLYALTTAELFAYSAVYIADAVGAVTHLSFGCECEEPSLLQSAANLLLSPDMKARIYETQKSGVSYAKARELALISQSPALAKNNLLQKSNNILAIEYFKALAIMRSPIIPVPILRTGTEHDAKDARDGFASAKQLRALAQSGDIDGMRLFLPESSFALFKAACSAGTAPVTVSYSERAILAKLRTMDAHAVARLRDGTEGLPHRLHDVIYKSCSLDEIIERTQTKRYPRARIRRMLMCAYLGIEKNDLSTPPPYVKVLALNKHGRKILRHVVKSTRIPIITKVSEISALPRRAQKVFEIEVRATDLYTLSYPEQGKAKARKEFKVSPIYEE